MTRFNIEIVSDTVCPWCYVGKQRLEKAISAYKSAHPDSEDTFSTTWLPFYLNPSAPREGIDKRKYYFSKFGEDRTKMIFERLAAAGKEDNISFKFGGKTGNTRDSHRLIQLGKSKSPAVQTRVVEELFKAYFENEKDITSHKVLYDAGVKAGLTETEVKEWLESDKGGRQVDEEVREAQMSNIHGVPNFTIQGKYEIGGAQEPTAFVQIFERVKANEAS
ncbi:MAG: hypothetical protein M1827_004246 [Pycnora praestabilis]|nr:MAG: hypothetical protein M1827_004246 [Pycnora praestabilis]